MKILITGINGLVGSFIARKLLDEGHEIYGLVRKKSNLDLLEEIKDKISFEIGDILDIPNLEKAIIGKDWVVHCAGLVSFAPKDKDHLFKINTEGTANIVNVSLTAGIKKLAYISSVAALGRQSKKLKSKNESISEANEWVESPDNSNYAKSKYLAELEVWRGVSEGLPAVIVNPSIILGETDWHKSSTKLFKYVFDENIFYTDGNLNFVDAKDLAEIVKQLLYSEIINERYIVSAGSIPQIDLFTKIAGNFSKKAPRVKIKGLIISILWRFEAIKSMLLGDEPLITKETAETAKRHIVYENKKIKTAINFNFTDLDETLKRVCSSLKENFTKDLEKK